MQEETFLPMNNAVMVRLVIGTPKDGKTSLHQAETQKLVAGIEIDPPRDRIAHVRRRRRPHQWTSGFLLLTAPFDHNMSVAIYL